MFTCVHCYGVACLDVSQHTHINIFESNLLPIFPSSYSTSHVVLHTLFMTEQTK